MSCNEDLVLPFRLQGNRLRGRMVKLGPVLDAVLGKHDYPAPVAHLLAETMVVACALAFALKYEGKFTLQSKGDGPVNLLAVDVTSEGFIRGYARIDTSRGHIDEGIQPIAHLGSGYLAFTVDQSNVLEDADTYQGIVELRGSSIAAAAQHYFKQSEQIQTGLQSFVARGADGRWHAAALMVQQMPDDGTAANENMTDEDWNRVMVLMATNTAEEMLSEGLAADEMLFRLFHEEELAIDAPQSLQFRCTCGERIPDTLRSFGPEQLEQMTENNVLTITCQFCNSSYSYDAKERAALFRGGQTIN